MRKQAKATLDIPTLEPTTANLYDTTIGLSLTRSGFGNRKKVSMNAVDVKSHDAVTSDQDASKKQMLSMSKRLLKSPELNHINLLDNSVDDYLDMMAVPSFFKPGIRLIKREAIKTVMTFLKSKADARQALVEKFVAALPGRIEAMKDILPPGFWKASDYPTQDEMRRVFGFSWRLVGLGAPTELKTIDASLYEEQTKQIAKHVEAAAAEIRALVRQGVSDTLKDLERIVTSDVSGKAARFRDNSIEKINTFLATFPMRDMTNDLELQKLVADAKAITGGLNAEIIRNDEQFRNAMAVKVKELIALQPVRAMSFDDDGPVQTPAQKAAATRKRSKAA